MRWDRMSCHSTCFASSLSFHPRSTLIRASRQDFIVHREHDIHHSFFCALLFFTSGHTHLQGSAPSLCPLSDLACPEPPFPFHILPARLSNRPSIRLDPFFPFLLLPPPFPLPFPTVIFRFFFFSLSRSHTPSTPVLSLIHPAPCRSSSPLFR